jgi:hypothetical protein
VRKAKIVGTIEQMSKGIFIEVEGERLGLLITLHTLGEVEPFDLEDLFTQLLAPHRTVRLDEGHENLTPTPK